MAVKSSGTDKFANIAFLSVTESAANTLTFAQLNMSTNLMDRKFALIIHRIEAYFGRDDQDKLVAANDAITMALTLTDRITDIANLPALSQPELLFQYSIGHKFDTAVASWPITRPYTKDFGELPGGGILVPGDRLFLGILGTSLATACTAAMRLFYTTMNLTTEDYWELIEARRIMTT